MSVPQPGAVRYAAPAPSSVRPRNHYQRPTSRPNRKGRHRHAMNTLQCQRQTTAKIVWLCVRRPRRTKARDPPAAHATQHAPVASVKPAGRESVQNHSAARPVAAVHTVWWVRPMPPRLSCRRHASGKASGRKATAAKERRMRSAACRRNMLLDTRE